MKHSLLFCTTFFAGVSLYAASPNSQGNQDFYGVENSKQSEIQITPTAPPDNEWWADPYFSADFIYWRAHEDGLEYAFDGLSLIQFDVNGVNIAPNASKGSVGHPDFQYKPGFKVGAGLKFKYDGWDFFAEYTWWQNSKSDSKTSVNRGSNGRSYALTDMFCPSAAIANGVFPPTIYTQPGSGLISPDVYKADAEWLLQFNALDLELGRNFWISKKLTLRPYIGMKFSWIEQKFDAFFQQIFAQTNPIFSVHLDNKLNQFGVGIRSGLDSAWYMSNNWIIFAELSVSEMWNDFDCSRKDILSVTGSPDEVIENLDNDFYNITAILESSIGLRYQKTFYNDNYMFLLQAAWEQQIWFGQNRMIFHPTGSPPNLTFDGLTVKAGFYF